MKCFTLLFVVFIPIILSEDVVEFGDNKQNPVEGGDVNPKTGEQVDEEDVNSRFFNVDLNSFAGQVAASALGTVAGNAGANIVGNFLDNCNNRGKRSILMHKLEKRQAIEANEKTGNTDEDPVVASRFICPQTILNPGGSNNGRYCDRCYCSDWDCRQDCSKCRNSGASGWTSSSGSNNNWGQSSSNNVNCNSCYCSSYSCRNTCNKCVSNSNNGHYNSNSGAQGHSGSSNGEHTHTVITSSTTTVNCNSCYCSNYSCQTICPKCRNNNAGWNNNGGSYNNGWRSSSSANGRNSENSDDSEKTEFEIVDSENNSEKKSNNDEDSVVFA